MAELGSPAKHATQPRAIHACAEFGLSARARSTALAAVDRSPARRRSEPSAVMGSAAEELMVCRLFAGGRWIRTSSTRARCIWLFAPFDAPGCLGRVGSRRSDPATTIAERVAFGRVPDKIGRQKGRADPSQAGKRDNQIHRARVLEVRIHLPPAESLRTIGSC